MNIKLIQLPRVMSYITNGDGGEAQCQGTIVHNVAEAIAAINQHQRMMAM